LKSGAAPQLYGGTTTHDATADEREGGSADDPQARRPAGWLSSRLPSAGRAA